jgi:hypothetical protein
MDDVSMIVLVVPLAFIVAPIAARMHATQAGGTAGGDDA